MVPRRNLFLEMIPVKTYPVIAFAVSSCPYRMIVPQGFDAIYQKGGSVSKDIQNKK